MIYIQLLILLRSLVITCNIHAYTDNIHASLIRLVTLKTGRAKYSVGSVQTRIKPKTKYYIFSDQTEIVLCTGLDRTELSIRSGLLLNRTDRIFFYFFYY